MAFPISYTLADKLALGTFHGFKNVANVLRSIHNVLLDGRSFTACASTSAAPIGFFNGFFFHNKKNVAKFANEKPCGEVALPLVQKRIRITSLRSIRIVMNQTLIEIRALIRHMVFHFSYSFQGFRTPFCNLSLITLLRYENFLNYASIFQRLSVKIS